MHNIYISHAHNLTHCYVSSFDLISLGDGVVIEDGVLVQHTQKDTQPHTHSRTRTATHTQPAESHKRRYTYCNLACAGFVLFRLWWS